MEGQSQSTEQKQKLLTSEQLHAYASYTAYHGKVYDTAEEFHRRARLFAEQDSYIKEWNASERGQRMQLGHN